MPRQFYEIQPADIGKRLLYAFGRTWSLRNVLGYVQPGDVGKRVYLIDGILQVENDTQRQTRVSRTTPRVHHAAMRGGKKSPSQLQHEIDEVLNKPVRGPTSARTTTAVRTPKTKMVHVIQGNYGYGHGWEDLTAEEDRQEALARLREYRENEIGIPFRRIRRRERIKTSSSGTSHATKKKIDPHAAKQRLETAGIDFSKDFHTLSSHSKDTLLEVARAAGYRKRKDAPGSTARMYFQYLSRLR